MNQKDVTIHSGEDQSSHLSEDQSSHSPEEQSSHLPEEESSHLVGSDKDENDGDGKVDEEVVEEESAILESTALTPSSNDPSSIPSKSVPTTSSFWEKSKWRSELEEAGKKYSSSNNNNNNNQDEGEIIDEKDDAFDKKSKFYSASDADSSGGQYDTLSRAEGLSRKMDHYRNDESREVEEEEEDWNHRCNLEQQEENILCEFRREQQQQGKKGTLMVEDRLAGTTSIISTAAASASAPPATTRGSRDDMVPGAFAVSGRAFGQYPAWGRNNAAITTAARGGGGQSASLTAAAAAGGRGNGGSGRRFLRRIRSVGGMSVGGRSVGGNSVGSSVSGRYSRQSPRYEDDLEDFDEDRPIEAFTVRDNGEDVIARVDENDIGNETYLPQILDPSMVEKMHSSTSLSKQEEELPARAAGANDGAKRRWSHHFKNGLDDQTKNKDSGNEDDKTVLSIASWGVSSTPLGTATRFLRCLCLTIAAISITVGIVIAVKRREEHHGTSIRTSVTENSTSKRFQTVVSILSSVDLIVNTNATSKLLDPTSPQYRAASWLADEDEYPLDLTDVDSVVQRYAVAAFFFATGGGDDDIDENVTVGEPSQETKNRKGKPWNKLDVYEAFLSSRHECEWNTDDAVLELRNNKYTFSNIPTKKGISCREGSKIVRNIVLPQINMTNNIPNELFLLTGLEWIEIWGNAISGFIPETIGIQLTSLTHLDMAFNKLFGPIPSTIGLLTGLQSIWLENNFLLNGTLPIEMKNLRQLDSLALMHNRFSGTVPEWLGELQYLTRIEFHTNAFMGTIPRSIYGLQNLILFNMANQSPHKLNGTLDLREGDLPSVRLFLMDGNHLTGTIPSSVGTFVGLEWFSISRNSFHGTIPSSISNLTNLKMLFLGVNALSGTIPDSIDRLTNLQFLIMPYNRLVGTLPRGLPKLKELGMVSFSFNRLNGTIPSGFGNMFKLWEVAFHSNHLTGTIPSSMGTNINLRQLQLADNSLVGNVPESLVNLKNLQFLSLSRNSLEGDINFLCNINNSNTKALPTTIWADSKGPSPEVNCQCCQGQCNDNDDQVCEDKVHSRLAYLCEAAAAIQQASRPTKEEPKPICDNNSILYILNKGFR